MSTPRIKTFKEGDTIAIQDLNDAFGQLEDASEDLTSANVRDEGILRRNLNLATIQSPVSPGFLRVDGASISSSFALGTYTTVINIANTVVTSSRDLVMVEWYIMLGIDSAAEIERQGSRVQFRLTWNIGSGIVQVPQTPVWEYAPWSRVSDATNTHPSQTQTSASGYILIDPGAQAISTLDLEARVTNTSTSVQLLNHVAVFNRVRR